MRVFMTGATGYVGNAVAKVLRERGHDVAALTRPESEAGDLRDRGVSLVAGDLETLPSLAETMSNYDAIVHAAAAKKDQPKHDRTAVDVFTSTNVFTLYTSGVWVLGKTGEKTADEDTPVNPLPLVAWRPPHEQKVLETGRGAVLRPGCVYGGRQALLGSFFAAAEQNGKISIVGDGNNHWCLVDLHDLADCYARIVEQRATGVFHAMDDTRATLNEMAKAVAPDSPIEHVPLETVRGAYGPFADALAIDQRVSSEKTRKALGWTPTRSFTSSIEEQRREWRETTAAAR
jgi:nucleoside-diphosphate-sugar epimerase